MYGVTAIKSISAGAFMGSHILSDLTTPAAVVDLGRLKSNTEWMSKRAHQLAVKLRPHVKTHKCIEAARYQVNGHSGAIAVSTLAEAEQFANAGFHDITYAVPLAPGRARRAAILSQRITSLQVLVDHEASVLALSEAMAITGGKIEVLVKIDCGYGRAGLEPSDLRLIPLVQQIEEHAQLEFVGVLAHAGHAYDCSSVDEIKAIAEIERSETVRAADRIRAHGIPVRVVSVGSTPTASHVEDLSGVTELRPGNYALFDLFQASIGSCSTSDVALSVLSEVIGVYPERDTVLIDAGALALSKDPGATHVTEDSGFGVICDLDLNPIHGLALVGLSQEHGKVLIDEAFVGELPKVGDRIRILPNHSCLVTALHHLLHVVDSGSLVEEWSPVRGW
jgi:D-serine deaminase-like pyridoxal phosphate-dependent protein